jgi:signal transduction histidine kinase
LRPQVDVRAAEAQYGGRVGSDEVRRIVPVLAVAVAVVAALVDSSAPGELLLMAIPPVALAAWTYLPRIPLPVVAIAVLVPVVAVQHSGHHEPIMFEVSVLAFVVACWIDSLALAVVLGVLAVAAPVVVGAIETSGDLGVGTWIVGVAFPWLIGRTVHRQVQLAAALEATRAELAAQAMLEERRRIARDVHDFVGHGLAAVMLQLTSARHVLRRDPDAAEEALRTAEDVGRRSMRELRRTVALLRSEEEDGGVAPPVPTADEISALVAEARAGGLDVSLQVAGNLAQLEPGVGLALHRIAQEALANATRHASHARTVLEISVGDGEVSLAANTVGPLTPVAPAPDPERRSYGVVGMRERAAALGGELSAGPTVDGWRVSCRLPLRAAEGE